MVKHQYTVVAPRLGGTQSLVIDEEMEVSEVRAIIAALLGMNDPQELVIMCAGRQLCNSLGVWKVGMSSLFPDRYHEATDVLPPSIQKLHCTIAPKNDCPVPTAASLREAFPNREMSGVEREQMLKQYEPMIDMAVQNPDIFRQMLGKNAMNSELQELFKNKEAVKRIMMSFFDPVTSRELSREMNLKMVQIQRSPEESQMLQSFLDRFQENDCFALHKKSFTEVNEATEKNSLPVPSQTSNNRSLSNPWARGGQASLDRGGGMNNLLPSFPMNFRNGNDIFGGLNAATAPPARAINFSSPYGQATTSPETTWNFGSAPTLHPAQGISSPIHAPSPSIPNSLASREDLWRSLYGPQLQELKSMGFSDEKQCLEALAASHGDLGGALDYINNLDSHS